MLDNNNTQTVQVTHPILQIKAGALKKLCYSVRKYNYPQSGQLIADGLFTTLKHYNDDEMFPIVANVYEALLRADKW